MKTYDIIVIGFGKAGKTLAAKMAARGKKVALIEESAAMYGGTCINIACIPTKTLSVAAEKGLSFDEVMQQKDAVVSRLNTKNYNMLKDSVDIIDAHASFVDDKTILASANGESMTLSADTIIINTGAIPSILPIPGLSTAQNVYDSTSIQKLDKQPKRLGIIGGGNIGLEFANIYAHLGTQVTVLDASDQFLPMIEESIASLAKQYLEEDGISIRLNTRIQSVSNDGDSVVIQLENDTLTFDAVLYATGRKPNIDGLHLENTHIQVNERGAIVVDEFCQTTVKSIYAVGDVNGGPQFTYVSLDDFRIVFGALTGAPTYSLKDRQNIPTSLFITPALARVGLTQKQAEEQGLPVASKELLVAGMPRAHVNNDLRGAFKAVVNTETKEILGATIFAQGAQEIINIITVAMDNKIPYTYFTKQLFTHPTMAENLNDLFAI